MTGDRAATELVDTHEMVVVHRAFRRESRLLADLVAATPTGDRRRARILAGHLRWYRAGLHSHHHGEDELIWPLLRARVDLDAGSMVARMEQQHERIAESLERVMSALPAWLANTDVAARYELARALTEHRAVLVRHLDDEETQLLPLAGRHLSQPEWDALGEHFVRTTPKSQLLIFLGAVLEDADAAERAALLGAMPLIARLVWRGVGHRLYTRRITRVRGRPVPVTSPEPRTPTPYPFQEHQ